MDVTKATAVHAEALAIKAEMDRLAVEYRQRIDYLASAVSGVTGKHTTETGSFTVRENNTYDDDAMRASLLPGQVRRCSVMKLDKAAVKRLYPGVYAAAQRKNGVSVTL